MTNKKKEIKVSIIMSLFNVEFFMRTAIESVLNQTLQDIELICINDGSSDYSLETAQEYAEKDDRIKIITYKESKGQAYARNRGMDIAKGKYICFVDGDDWIDLNMVEKLYNEAEKNQTEITFCAAALYNELLRKVDFSNTYYNLSLIPHSFDNRVFSQEEAKNLLTGSINVALWNKIYRTDFLNKNKLRFPEYFIYEDMTFFYDVWFKAERISLIRDFLYYYRINRNGSTMSKIGSKVLDRTEMVAMTYELFKEQPYFEEIKTQVNMWIIDDLIHRYTLVEPRYKKEFFFLMKKLFKNLDLKGADLELLSKSYCYNEYKNCISMKYEDFERTLLEISVNAKRKENELNSKNISDKYKVQCFYENIINNINAENERNIKSLEKSLREEYENRIRNLQTIKGL